MFNSRILNNHPATLKTAHVYCESGKYYLKLVYEYENDDGTHQLIYPKVVFPFPQNWIPYMEIDSALGGESISLQPYPTCTALPGDVTATNYAGVTIATDSSVVDCLIKKKVHKMTIEEIEKSLAIKSRL